MSLNRTTCPECGAGLKSAAGFNPGQQVRCPKCSTAFAVPEPEPEFEAVEDEAPAPKRKGPPARAARADDADDRPRRKRRPRDDDEDDDRPRGRRPDGGKKKSILPLLLGIGAAVLLMCCVTPVGAWFFFVQPKIKEAAEKLDQELKKAAEDAKKKTNPAGGGSLPAGWTKFEAPDKSVRAAFPGTPDDGNLTMQTPTVTSAKSWQYVESDGSLTCTLAVVKFRPKSKAADQERELKAAAGLMSLGVKDAGPPRTVSWLGGSAKETDGRSSLTDATVVTRSVVVDGTGYIAVVQHKNKADAVATFFSSVEPSPK